MAGAAAFDDAAKVTDLIQTVDLIHEVTAAVGKIESELALNRLSTAASTAWMRHVNDKVDELRQRVEDLEARLSMRFADSTTPHVDDLTLTVVGFSIRVCWIRIVSVPRKKRCQV